MTKRKITVSVTIQFVDMYMESTDAAVDIVKGIMMETGEDCKREFRQSLEDAGAKDVVIHMVAY